VPNYNINKGVKWNTFANHAISNGDASSSYKITKNMNAITA